MLRIIGSYLTIFILLAAGLFDPTHAGIGLWLFGTDPFLIILGQGAGAAVIIYNVLFTLITILYLMMLFIFYFAEQPLNDILKSVKNRPIVDPALFGLPAAALQAFMFASGFYYTGVIGILMNIIGLHAIKIINQHISLTINDDVV